ncbi:hypothetical protein LJC24_04155 [Desulfococcaceae bacterium OttesenSCG-928-F15]|nr:hypothetical protein [Desulfococcaceae bacterium OttesenSCG-928-F15]
MPRQASYLKIWDIKGKSFVMIGISHAKMIRIFHAKTRRREEIKSKQAHGFGVLRKFYVPVSNCASRFYLPRQATLRKRLNFIANSGAYF